MALSKIVVVVVQVFSLSLIIAFYEVFLYSHFKAFATLRSYAYLKKKRERKTSSLFAPR